jgi:AP-1-like factor
VETLETTVLESKSKRPSGSLPSLSPPPKRARRLAGASIGRQALEITSLLISTPPSPPLTASSWDNHSTYFPPSLSTTIPRMASSFNDLDGSPSSNDFPPSINDVTPLTFADINPGSLGCGLCSNGGPCLCDEILRGEQPKAPVESSVPLADIEDHPFVQPRSCLLSNPPPYQAPVPLRRRPNTNKTSTIFAIRAPPADATSSTSTCSGDPSNCLACADDPFGKAFCTAVNQSMMAVSPEPCGNCPRLGIDPVITGSGNGCRSPCASCPRRDGPATRAAPLHLSISSSNASVPCNVVWQQIKEHPNASFADLRLLADVVARRSKCTGPRVARSPTPIPQSNSTGSFLDEELLGQEDSSRHTATAPPPPKTTAHGVATHIRCGRSSLREVPAEAVRDALRLLDVIHDQRGLEYD